MHSFLVCILQTAPIVAMKAFPSSREEFPFNLLFSRWKSTGIRALQIFISRFLIIPPEFLLELSKKVNESSKSSMFRPYCSAITFGSMLTEEHVSQSLHGNSMPFNKHGITKFSGSLFLFSVILLFIFFLTSWNIFSMSCSVFLFSVKNIHNLWEK